MKTIVVERVLLTSKVDGTAVAVVSDTVAADEGLVLGADVVGVLEGHGLEGHALVDALGVGSASHGGGNAGEEKSSVGNHLD